MDGLWQRLAGTGRWSRLAAQAQRLGPAAIERLRHDARAERQALDRFLLATDSAVSRNRHVLAALALPTGTDWRWRPEMLLAPLVPQAVVAPHSGTGLGASAQLHHDCPLRAAILTQVPNRRATDLAPFGIRLEVMAFAGSFLALSIPLPAEARAGLSRRHIIRLETSIGIERGVEIYARLNVENGPNVDQVQRHLAWMRPGPVNGHVTEFDLAETELEEDRVSNAWVDLILERPRMNAVVLRDAILSRHPRAEI